MTTEDEARLATLDARIAMLEEHASMLSNDHERIDKVQEQITVLMMRVNTRVLEAQQLDAQLALLAGACDGLIDRLAKLEALVAAMQKGQQS